MANEFSQLEQNILRAKGLTADQLAALSAAGIASREDLNTVGDTYTLMELVPGIAEEAAEKVMSWATGRMQAKAAAVGGNVVGGNFVLDTADVVYCVHCGAKQPKDYKSGDLCIACGKQAEPILTCFWCSASGPGKFCRTCGAEFVPTAELDLAILLRREGLPKDDVPKKLRSLSPDEKDIMWGRVRKMRG